MPGLLGADTHIILLVDVFQELDIEPLVPVLGITKIAKILKGEKQDVRN